MSRTTTSANQSGSRIATLFIALFAFVVHIRALANGLVSDDVVIMAHPLIQSITTIPASFGAAWWYSTNHLYRPLTLFTFGIERSLVGPVVWLPHAVNIALHVGVTLLLSRLLSRFTQPRAVVVAALLFAVLPVHVEAIASVVGRAELLAGIMMLGVMLLATSDAPSTPWRRAAMALLSAGALASKETGVVAPLLAIAAAWTRPETRKTALAWGASAFVGTVALLAARFVVLGTLAGDAANPVFRDMSSLHRVAVALAMLPRSAAMLFLPVAPAIDFVPAAGEIARPSWLAVAGGVLVVVAIVAMVVLHTRRPSLATFGACVLAATAAPTANLVFASGVVLDARTLYGPSIGAMLMVGYAIDALDGARARRLAEAGTIVLAAMCAVVSWNEVPVWRSNNEMLATMIRRQPQDYRSYAHLAYEARDAGDDVQSLAQFRRAIDLFRHDSEMLTDAATVALRMRDTSTAKEWLLAAVDANARAARARTRLVGVLLVQGDSVRARELLAAGLAVEPDQRQWRIMLGDTTQPSRRR